MRETSLLVVTVACLLAACGGSVSPSESSSGGSGGNAAGAGGSGQGGQAAGAGGSAAGAAGSPSDPLQGSYDLSFTSITASPPLPSESPISLAVPFRLDIRKTGGGYEAALTGRWGDQFPMELSVSETEVRLAGSAAISGMNGFASGQDTWNSFSLARGAGGVLQGPFWAKGKEDVMAGDIAWMANLEGTGTVTGDALVPEAKLLAPAPGSPPQGRLPWEKLAVRFAEGVHPADTDGALSLDDGVSTQPVFWQALSSKPDLAWAGRIELDGYLPSWSLAGWTPTLSLRAGIRDLAEHEGPGWKLGVAITDVGPAFEALTFDGDAIPMLATWGPGDVHYYGQKMGWDPHCESGGCVQIGPFEQKSCPAGSMGLAGRIKTAMSWITLRYRVVAAANAWESGPPTDWYSPFWVDLAVPGVVPVSVEAPLEKYVHYLGPGDGDETWWATEWRSWNLPVPVNPTPPEGLGFAIHTGSLTDACFGEMLPPGKRAIVIEEISPIGVK